MSELKVNTITAAGVGQNLVLQGGVASDDGTMDAGVVTLPMGSMVGTTPLGEGGGGAWNLIGSTVASSTDTTLIVTGIDTTYSMYAIGLSDFAASAALTMRVGTSSEIIETVSYRYHVQNSEDGGGGYGMATIASSTTGLDNQIFVTAVSAPLVSAFLYMGLGPRDVQFTGSWTGRRQGDTRGGVHISSYQVADGNADISIDRIQISGGTFTKGRFSVWGISHA